MTEGPPSQQISTLYKYETEFCADSVEWCPHEPFLNLFVCANYQLKESTNAEKPCGRFGRILLFTISNDEGLKLLQRLETAAILDQKWCHCKLGGYSILGVVNAEKTLQIYRLNPELSELELVCYYKIEDDSSETLLLSLDWSTGKYKTNQPEITCSDSQGNIHRFSLNDNKLERKASWHAHEFEAWITAFNYWDPNIIFTGGDDSVFSKFDARTGCEPIARNRSHEAGVTSIHSNSEKEHILATGSYDAKVRLWDCRYLKNCTDFVEISTVWRLKWDPFYHQFLLAACMLGGAHIIDTKPEKIQIVESYYEHKNLVYGVDWSFLPTRKVTEYTSTGNVIIATCSFYDKLLCVSTPNLKYDIRKEEE